MCDTSKCETSCLVTRSRVSTVITMPGGSREGIKELEGGGAVVDLGGLGDQNPPQHWNLMQIGSYFLLPKNAICSCTQAQTPLHKKSRSAPRGGGGEGGRGEKVSKSTFRACPLFVSRQKHSKSFRIILLMIENHHFVALHLI